MTDTDTEPTTDTPTREPASVTATLATLAFELGPIAKGDRMTGAAGNYNYRGIDALLRKLSPLMSAYGVTFVPRVMKREVESVNVGRDKVWRLVTLTVRYTVTGPAGDSIEVTVCGEGMDGGDKAANKAMTSAYKQALVQCFAVADGHDDPDNMATPEDAGLRREAAPARRAEGRAAAPAARPQTTHPVINAQGDRTEEEVAIRAIIGNLPDEPSAVLRSAFGQQFGSGLVALDPARHAEALAWVTQWVENNIAPTETNTGEPQ